MKSVLISIRPEWCKKVVSGEKTFEVRRTKPKLEAPFKCYIYCTKSTHFVEIPGVKSQERMSIDGKVIGEFVCDRIIRLWVPDYSHKKQLGGYAKYIKESCVPYHTLAGAFENDYAYFWHISDLKVYNKPKELETLIALRKTKFGYEPNRIKRAPQSWCYVEEP